MKIILKKLIATASALFFVYQNRSNEIIITQKAQQQIKQIGLYSLPGSLLKLVNNPES